MQVWKDYQTGRYFKIDQNSGTQSASNKFGKEIKDFVPYSSGFSVNSSFKEPDLNLSLNLQPKKFDGYCQFPRPAEPGRVLKPYIRKITSPSCRLPAGKVPQPLGYLTTGHISVKPRLKLGRKCSSSKELSFSDIEAAKKRLPRAASQVKTKIDLEEQGKTEGNLFKKGEFNLKKKEERRIIKGLFLTKFKTGAELVFIEKRVIEKTNPVFREKNLKQKVNEFKRIEKKRRATKLLTGLGY